jgi:F-type H+-transporting ATPase subunit b
MAVDGSHGPGMKELFTGIHLLAVLAIIYFAGRKGLSVMIKDRSLLIEKDIIDARVQLEKIRHETERARQEIAQVAKTREKLVSEIQTEGQKLYNVMVDEAKITSQRILADAKLAAENEVQLAMGRLKEEVVAKAVDRAVAVVSENGELRSNIHEKLFGTLSNDIVGHAGVLKNGV